MAQSNSKPDSVRSIHQGHRQRVKKKFLEQGGAPLSDYELLELMLFYAIPQGDVNPLAHRLMNRYGSIQQLLEVPPAELIENVGVTEHTAVLFRLFTEVMKRYEENLVSSIDIVNSAEDAGELLRPCFIGARNEMVYLLSVDAKGRVLGCDRISEGSADAVLLNARRIAQIAIHRRATQVFLAHCHTSGLAIPSGEDIRATHNLAQALRLLNIILTDHLVFADGDYVSMVQSGLMERDSRLT